MNQNVYLVSVADEGKRLDQFLKERTGLTRSEVQKWIKAGNVSLLPKKMIHSNYHVSEGDRISFFWEEKKKQELIGQPDIEIRQIKHTSTGCGNHIHFCSCRIFWCDQRMCDGAYNHSPDHKCENQPYQLCPQQIKNFKQINFGFFAVLLCQLVFLVHSLLSFLLHQWIQLFHGCLQ